MLHGKSFDGAEMAKITGELGAVVGGTERGNATDPGSHRSDRSGAATPLLAKVTSPDQQRLLSEEIQEARGPRSF